MTKVVFSPAAKKDLEEIGDYVAFQLHNKPAARKLIAKIQNSVYLLRQFPEAGTPLDNAGSHTIFRYLICGNYMIFYVLSNGDAHIVRILYSRRDYLRLLFGNQSVDETD